MSSGALLPQTCCFFFFYNGWRVLQPDTVGWLLVCLGAALADLAWRRSAHPSYLRLGEATASLMILAAFGLAGVLAGRWPGMRWKGTREAAASVCRPRVGWRLATPALPHPCPCPCPSTAWMLLRDLLNDQAPRLTVGLAWASTRPAAAAALHLAHMLFASGALKMGINCLSLPVRWRCGGPLAQDALDDQVSRQHTILAGAKDRAGQP